MYLNLWLDEQKRIHINVNSEITDEGWNNIEKLWSYLVENDSSSKCARQKNGYDLSHIQERMELMTYCINRDYIKSLCEPSLKFSRSISPRCSDFSDYTDKYYKIFHGKKKCFDAPFESQDYRYFISEDCDLNNMPKTFPRFDSTNKKIVYDDRSRKPIEQCERAAKVVDDGEVLVNPPSGLAAGSNELAPGPDGLAPGPGGLTDDYPESEYSPPKSTVFDLPSHTDLTSTENGTSKTIYYSGLSLSGVFFTSMVLYKV
ncbi:hypothetical protein PVIIG_05389 [Plasmodium vivax India VII]|uniref:Uncharacterized protein n=2 Tax=Plasmodium vivax TaxID=5855 RepID=A0A0J9UTN8_PLAVI|nr:hypothetical protein PVIIG_05389 [Plasmodium vivax India VII]KMZ83390.1 hypothetical protein PVBG_06293 [Plasmodium vivax Brazil I]